MNFTRFLTFLIWPLVTHNNTKTAHFESDWTGCSSWIWFKLWFQPHFLAVGNIMKIGLAFTYSTKLIFRPWPPSWKTTISISWPIQDSNMSEPLCEFYSDNVGRHDNKIIGIESFQYLLKLLDCLLPDRNQPFTNSDPGLEDYFL